MVLTNRPFARWALVPAILVAVTACGDGGDDDATTTDTSDTVETTTTSTTAASTTTSTSATSASTTPTSVPLPDASAPVALQVEVTADGAPLRSGSLTCGETAQGSGYLADPAVVAVACDLLQSDPGVAQRLTDGPPDNLLCTEIYGGPEVARVTGTIDGRPVDTTVDRTDGCGIDDWNTLAALLGPTT